MKIINYILSKVMLQVKKIFSNLKAKMKLGFRKREYPNGNNAFQVVPSTIDNLGCKRNDEIYGAKFKNSRHFDQDSKAQINSDFQHPLHKMVNDQDLNESDLSLLEFWKNAPEAEELKRNTNSLLIEQVVVKMKLLCEPYSWQEFVDTIESGNEEEVKKMVLNSISYKIMIGRVLTERDMKNLRSYFNTQEQIDDFILRNRVL